MEPGSSSALGVGSLVEDVYLPADDCEGTAVLWLHLYFLVLLPFPSIFSVSYISVSSQGCNINVFISRTEFSKIIAFCVVNFVQL